MLNSDDELMTIFAKEMERPVSEGHPLAGQQYVSLEFWQAGVAEFRRRYGRTPIITSPPGAPSYETRLMMKNFFQAKGWIR